MPQIAQLATTYASQIFWLLVCFGVVFFVVGRGLLPKVTGTIDLRDRQIAADLAAAEAARSAADAEEEAWRANANRQRAAAQDAIAKAKVEAAAHTAARLAEASDRIEQTLAAADARIGDARAAALTEIEAVAVDAVQDIAARVAGLSVSPDQAGEAVKGVLAHG
ncbi:ATPase [Novosphingobium sp.]|uniref:F0F1 ATP synthase subunit B family protein n=1 Tax=Novosphingobium sp. TaxID=1874826 RepID=UPI0038B98627